MAKVITFTTMKGGAGKTMMAVNLAAILSESSRVLLVDVDPQANATSGLGIDISIQERLTCADIFENSRTSPEDIVIGNPVEALPNLDLIPSTIFLTKTELQLVSRGGRERLLSNYIKDHEGFFERYDYIILDTNPSMGIVNQNAFFLADSIVLVTDVSMNGIQGVELFQFLWDDLRGDLRKENNVNALVINNLDRRLKLASELTDYCESDEDLRSILVKPYVPARAAYKDAEIEGVPINVYKPRSEEQTILSMLVDSLKERGVF